MATCPLQGKPKAACRSAWPVGGIIDAHPLYGNPCISNRVSVLGGLFSGSVPGTWALWDRGGYLRSKSKFAIHRVVFSASLEARVLL